MTKADHELITDAVRLTCPLNIKDGAFIYCATGRTRSNCTCSCDVVREFWETYTKLKTKEIEL